MVPQKEGTKLMMPPLADVYGGGNWAFGGGWLGCVPPPITPGCLRDTASCARTCPALWFLNQHPHLP